MNPVRVLPVLFVLHFPAAFQQYGEIRPRRQAAGHEVAPHDHVPRRPLRDEVAARLGEERLSRGRVACGPGAPQVIGLCDPDQERERHPGRVELSGEAPVAPGGRPVPDEESGGEMVQDQGAHPPDEILRRAQALEEGARRLDSALGVLRGADPARGIHTGGERLAEVVAERRQHQGEVVVAPVAKPRRFVHHHEGMHPHVALRMPLRVLGNSDQGPELGKEAQQAARLEEPEARGGAAALEQHLAKLPEDAFPRYLAERRPGAERHQGGIRVHLEPGDELRHPQRPQGVLGEGARIRGAEHSELEVPPPSEGIDDLLAQGVERNGVDGEIAPAGRALEVEVRIARDREAAVPGRDLAVAARQGEIRVHVGEAQHAEALSHPQHAAKGGEQGLERIEAEPEHLDVDILRVESEEAIAHEAADEKGPSSRCPDRARDIENHRIEHARMIAPAVRRYRPRVGCRAARFGRPGPCSRPPRSPPAAGDPLRECDVLVMSGAKNDIFKTRISRAGQDTPTWTGKNGGRIRGRTIDRPCMRHVPCVDAAHQESRCGSGAAVSTMRGVSTRVRARELSAERRAPSAERRAPSAERRAPSAERRLLSGARPAL